MSHFLKISALFAIVLWAASCAKYQTQYEGPYTEGSDGGNNTAVKFEIVYCINGQLFVCDKNLRNAKQLPVVGSAQRAAINNDHTKIVYESAGQNLRIVDIEGNYLYAVPNSDNLKWFDWHANNETIYMLESDNAITTNGPAITLSTTNAKNALPYLAFSHTINAIAVSPVGDVMIGFEVYDGLYFTRGVYVDKINNQGNYLNLDYLVPSSMRLSANGEVLLVNGEQSGFSPYSYITYDLNFLSALSSFRGAALSPDGQEVIGWYDSDYAIRSYHNANKVLDVQDTNGLTDIDW